LPNLFHIWFQNISFDNSYCFLTDNCNIHSMTW
jgi:hypothetical protein